MSRCCWSAIVALSRDGVASSRCGFDGWLSNERGCFRMCGVRPKHIQSRTEQGEARKNIEDACYVTSSGVSNRSSATSTTVSRDGRIWIFQSYYFLAFISKPPQIVWSVSRTSFISRSMLCFHYSQQNTRYRRSKIAAQDAESRCDEVQDERGPLILVANSPAHMTTTMCPNY